MFFSVNFFCHCGPAADCGKTSSTNSHCPVIQTNKVRQTGNSPSFLHGFIKTLDLSACRLLEAGHLQIQLVKNTGKSVDLKLNLKNLNSLKQREHQVSQRCGIYFSMEKTCSSCLTLMSSLIFRVNSDSSHFKQNIARSSDKHITVLTYTNSAHTF